MRLDKWLWAARFFKTRALATKACDLNRIHSNEIAAKPAREVRVGDTLRIKTEAGDFTVEVIGLSELRGPATEAQALYKESEASQAARLKAIEDRRAMLQFGGATEVKPSKKDRRVLDRFRRR
ncbi:MAG: RNA-binding domain protein [Bryobacterales bacterium]|nr:RNA-binding domain protein [Bryobacterales bacterium]